MAWMSNAYKYFQSGADSKNKVENPIEAREKKMDLLKHFWLNGLILPIENKRHK